MISLVWRHVRVCRRPRGPSDGNEVALSEENRDEASVDGVYDRQETANLRVSPRQHEGVMKKRASSRKSSQSGFDLVESGDDG
jgi:hypothetical protein